MKVLIIIVLLLFIGCYGLTPEETVKRKDVCVKGGMDYEIIKSGVGAITNINCIKKNKK